MIGWIVFDLDGTLYDPDDYFRPAFRHLGTLCSQRVSLDPSTVESFLWNHLRRKGSHYRRLFDDLLMTLAPGVPHQDLVRELVHEFHHVPVETLALYDDAKRFLTTYQSQVGFALITNGSAIKQIGKIQALGLLPLMTAIVYCQDLHAPKPASRAYEHLLGLLRCRGDECLYIGDNPPFDFPGAKAVGMGTVHLRRGEFRDAASPAGLTDLAVQSFDELPAWLADRLAIPEQVEAR